MNFATVLTALCILAAVAVAILIYIKKKRRGSACHGDCSCCNGCCHGNEEDK